MNPENVSEEAAERSPAAHRTEERCCAEGGKVMVFKFGGSSLLGAERILQAARLVRQAAQVSKVTVVVSAMKGVTDHLLSIEKALVRGKPAQARRAADVVLELHLEVLEDLRLGPETDRRMLDDLHQLGRDLFEEVLAWRDGAGSAEFSDRLASFGERFSARLLAAALEKLEVASVPVTSSEFVLTCDTFRDAQPHLEQSRQRGRKILLPLLKEGAVPVVTGFIGATPDGRITTLGRNSSDFSGAIVAYVVDAAELVIWTDVDGIYTANPQLSSQARLLHDLYYEEAHALAARGARVLHPKVLPLAAESKMVVWVRNTFNAQARGTRIGPRADFSDAIRSGGMA